MKISIDQIIITTNNPRQTFDEEKLRELGESIKTYGLLEPIIVRQRGNNYELVVGERRLRASALVGLDSIEASVKEVDDSTAYELRLIENIHREDLSNAEKGDAILSLWANYDKYETIKAVCEALHLNYGTVMTQWISSARKLSNKVKELVSSLTLPEDASKSLIKYPHNIQEKLANAIIKYDIRGGQQGGHPYREFLKLYDVNPNQDLGDIAREVQGIETVVIPKSKLPIEVLEKLEEEKIQFAKVKRIQRQRNTISKPQERITKEAVKERFDKKAKTDFKYEQVQISHGSGKEPSLKTEIEPLIVPNESKPDYSLCQCALCTLFGSHCKGRCWNV